MPVYSRGLKINTPINLLENSEGTELMTKAGVYQGNRHILCVLHVNSSCLAAAAPSPQGGEAAAPRPRRALNAGSAEAVLTSAGRANHRGRRPAPEKKPRRSHCASPKASRSAPPASPRRAGREVGEEDGAAAGAGRGADPSPARPLRPRPAPPWGCGFHGGFPAFVLQNKTTGLIPGIYLGINSGAPHPAPQEEPC